MSFKLLLLAPDLDPSWPDKIRQAVPGVDVKAFADPQDAGDDITDADAEVRRMDVAAWLRKLGLEQYEPAFRANEIDEGVLASLTAEDLKDLGHAR
jgi:hypothetical protein